MAAQNGYWRKHPKKELQEVLMLFHVQTWRIIDPPKYYKVYCSCAGKHKSTIHLSPSGADYAKNKIHWLKRQPCYKEGMGGAK